MQIFSFDKDDVQTLIELGLNRSQAKIYLALVSLGVANAKEISKIAKIDNADVYRQLEKLQTKSIVEKIITFPNNYKPMALNEVIEMLIEQKNRENTKIAQKAKALSKKTIRRNTTKKEEYEISIIPKGKSIIRYYKRAYERVQKEWLWYTPIERIPKAIDFYNNETEKAFARGIRLRTIAELTNPTDEILGFIQKYKEENPNFDIKFANSTLNITFALRDDKELDIFTKASKDVADSPALYTNNSMLIKLIKNYFELIWNSAMKEYPKKNNKN